MTYTRTARPVAEEAHFKQRIVRALQRRVVADATGLSDPPFVRYSAERPDSRFWLGALVPEEEVEMPDRPRSSVERVKPASQGFNFRLGELPAQLEITLSFSVWVTLHPTFEEQFHGAGLDEEAAGEEGSDGTEDERSAGHETDPRLELARARMKVPVEGVTIRVPLDPHDAEQIEPKHVGRAQVGTAIREAFRRLPDDTVLHRPLRRPGGTRPRQSDVRDRAAWEAWGRENLADPARPDWAVEVDVDVRPLGDDSYEVLVTMVNRSPGREHQFTDRDRTQGFVRWACDPAIYEARMHVRPSGRVVPYELEQIPESYRYDRRVRALGWNCAVTETDDGFETSFAAVAETERIWPRETATDRRTPLDTRFRTLAEDSLRPVDRLLSEAERWVAKAWDSEALDELAERAGWDEETRGQAASDAQQARQEIEWVRSGARLLGQDDALLRAFRLMNETMSRVAGNRYDSWRPFQLAFILGCLPAVADPGRDETVDILWFPTGGGKTEAYLGLNALLLFYERMRGRTGGSQTWARFPLRLLSLQQTQRFAESVLLAETVRLEHEDLREGEPFGVGYLVGAGNTPNRIELPDSRFYDGWDPFLEANQDSCRVLESCPSCGRKPEVTFDRDSYTMEHRCETAGCALEGRLPVYVIDDDIYRWAPSVIVGTVDKLTQLSWSNGFRHLLGQAYGRCDRHGLSRTRGRCAVWGCDRPLQPVDERFRGLRLEIQDEMHLLSESLGALDGNYETLFHSIGAACGIPHIKIIGATATIEGYREQSDHLYRRKPRRFPVPGPTRYESFWAFENPGDPLRTYVAILPRGTTMLDAAFRITRSHRAFLEEALADPEAFCERAGIDADRAAEVKAYLSEFYDVFTTYALRKTELDRYQRDVMDSPTICPDGAWGSITGDVEFWDVREVLQRLEDPETDARRLRILGATSAISHGVDIDRLNIMCVMGMPNQTAEFIQATARVGRIHPGLVFCLVNPMRERDVSHFRYFRKWAEYLDRLVEHVPVNRESLPVLELVLPGGFMAWLLQVEEPRWLDASTRRDTRRRLWGAAEVARAIDAGEFDEGEIAERLLESFAVDPHDPRFSRHRELTGEFVEKVFRRLQLDRGADASVPDVLEANGTPVPRSLRDVDTLIRIRGDW